jgi:hypothetical protein
MIIRVGKSRSQTKGISWPPQIHTLTQPNRATCSQSQRSPRSPERRFRRSATGATSGPAREVFDWVVALSSDALISIGG